MAALNSALFVCIPQQFTVSRRRLVDLRGTSSGEDVVSCMLEECVLKLVDGLCQSRRDLEVVDCRLLVCSEFKQDDVTESSDVSTSDRGAKTYDV